jgi:hypothetical protein
MNDLEKRVLDMLRNVRNFGSTHEALFAVGTLGRELFDNIGNIVEELERLAAEQSTKRAEARQYMANKAAVRAALLEGVTIINRTARVMDIDTPGTEDQFRMPHNLTDQLLLDTARAFLVNSVPHRATFLRHEVPASVFQEMEDNITAFQEALALLYQAGEASVEAGASFDAKMEHALDHVRQLHAIVRNKFHDNPAVLAAWEHARHVERAPRRSKPDTSNTPPSDGNTPPPSSTD